MSTKPPQERETRDSDPYRHSSYRNPLRRKLASWLRRGGNRLLLPFRVLNNFLNHWGFGQLLVEQSYRVRSLIRSVTRWDGSELSVSRSDDELVVQELPSAKTLANPIWWVVWLFQFPWLWLVSRPHASMLLALPGLCFLGGAYYLLNSGRLRASSHNSAKYRELLVEAASDGEYERARFYGDLVLQLNPRSAGDFYNRAILEARAGSPRVAKELMAFTATRLKSEKACLWLADAIGDRGQVTDWTQEQTTEYSDWLNQLLAINPANVQAAKAMADVLRARGDLKGALEMLLPLADKDAGIDYIVVILQKELGFAEDAKQRAFRVAEGNKSLLKDVPELLETRLQTASLLVFLGKHKEALKLLVAGFSHAEEPRQKSRLQRGVADSLVLLANKIKEEDSSPRGLMTRLEYLQRAVGADATSPAVVSAVMEACIEAAEKGDEQLLVMREAIVQNVSKDAAHFILGTTALFDGQMDTALTHLEIAAAGNPNMPGILNNLAYAICQSEMPDLERALSLSNAAVSMSPNNAYARETRGQIYLKMERWRDAITDLELALSVAELRSLVRPGLAEAYAEIGQVEIAKRHNALLKQGR